MHLKKTLHRALLAALLAAASPLLLSAATVSQERDHADAGCREVTHPSGLKHCDIKVGQGQEAATGKIVEVHYIGWLKDGTKFDSTRDRNHPFTFRLGAGDGIKGWDEGLVGMKVGGKRQLIIPPELGFGQQSVGSVVPPNSVLYYEFELLGVR
ncbi:MAG TPA: FKBP-type peptidyl-prolyl cis-trans isomerase [Thermoanaerobaculia bacterium]|jgi:FKBP-type peptidyl-prolyl cis-trans isomerase